MMINPIRRNRNIGTARQGHGKDNRLVVPYPAIDMKSFYERLGEYKTVERTINGHTFKFVIEKTRRNSFHACTIEDVAEIIKHIPKEHYGELRLIIFRQPTRKEEKLKPVWGRLIYSYEFEDDYFPAIVLEAVDLDRKFKWHKKLDVESQRELERLRQDGHRIELGKKYFEADYNLENIRNTQLYRTLPHEFGHYVHYLEIVKRPLSELKKQVDLLDSQISGNDTSETNPLFDKWDYLDEKYISEIEKREEQYFSMLTNEKEAFAHAYAEKFQRRLKQEGLIPFDQIINEERIKFEGLNPNDFIK